MASIGKRLQGKVRDRTRDAAKAAKDEAALKASGGPSPNPMTNLLIADIALRGGGTLLKHAVEAGLLGATQAGTKGRKRKAAKVIKGRSLSQTLMGTVLARVATRSVPGALIVGGGLLAKTLYDRQRGHKALEAGKQAMDEQAEEGEKA